MGGYFRMEVKVVSKTGMRQNGAIGENSAKAASAYITASKLDVYSTVDAAAYISGDKIEAEQRTADYTRKKGVLFSEIVLPQNAPKRLQNPAVLWSEVDGMAKRSNADLYREWICCFEKHLTLEEMKKVARQFATVLAAEGMVVQYALHDEKGNGNYHVHFMAPCRGFDAEGNWQKRKVLPRTYQLDEEGNRIPVLDKNTGLQKKNKYGRLQWEKEPPVFVDAFNNPKSGNVQRWRELFAQLENQYLAEEYQVSPLSYKKQGIKKIPGKHVSKAAFEVHKKLVQQLHKMPPERRAAYIERILSQIEKKRRKQSYDSAKGNEVHNLRQFEESKEMQEIRTALQEDLKKAGRYIPPKQYVSKYTRCRARQTIEAAFTNILSYHERLRNEYNMTQEVQEQTAEAVLEISQKLTDAQDDLLIMFSSGMTAIMVNHLKQGEYDLTCEMVEQLGKQLLKEKQEEQDAAIREKLKKYRDRLGSIQSGNAGGTGTAGQDDCDVKGRKREIENTAERINELAGRIFEIRCREAAKREHESKKMFRKGRSR